MTVLVDDAVWAWQGDRWAHLASDHSFDELHEFANRLGVRRLAFQGDHYDVPTALRANAVELGARAVPSRTLVEALRTSGLRRRGAQQRWQERDTAILSAEMRRCFVAHWPAFDRVKWTALWVRDDEIACSASLVEGAELPPTRNAEGRLLAFPVRRASALLVDVVVPFPRS